MLLGTNRMGLLRAPFCSWCHLCCVACEADSRNKIREDDISPSADVLQPQDFQESRVCIVPDDQNVNRIFMVHKAWLEQAKYL